MGQFPDGDGEIRVQLHAYVRPVVKSGAFEIPVGYFKSERFHEIKWRVSGRAGPRNIAGILRNFGLIQKDSKAGIISCSSSVTRPAKALARSNFQYILSGSITYAVRTPRTK